jgi:hypothetical protein
MPDRLNINTSITNTRIDAFGLTGGSVAVGIWLETAEPVVTLLIFGDCRHFLIRFGDRPGNPGDNFVTWLPPSGRGDLELVIALDCGQEPEDLADISPVVHRIGHHRPDFALGADDEERTGGKPIICVDHPIFLDNFFVYVSNHGKRDFDPLELVEFEPFLDSAQPSDMGIERIRGDPNELGIERLKIGVTGGKCHEFGATDGGKVSGVGKKDDVLAGKIFRKPDVPQSRFRSKMRGHFSEEWGPRGASGCLRDRSIWLCSMFFFHSLHVKRESPPINGHWFRALARGRVQLII